MIEMEKKKAPRTTTKQKARRLLRFLEKKKKTISPLLILTHDFPDPDALACGFALYYMVKHAYDINARIVYGGVIGRSENQELVNMLKIPAHRFKAGDLKKYSHVALVDTQPTFENNHFPKERRATIVIDQHPPTDTPSADLAIVDTECGATSVILAQALLLLEREIPVRVATALVYGILTDTLDLYRAKRPDIIKTYLDILPFCDMRTLARIQNPSRSKKFFATLEKSIKNAMVRQKLIVSHLGLVENPDLVSQTADFLLTYKGMRWSLCTGRYNGKLHVSLRMANPQALAANVLRDIFENSHEAGGHECIAGGSFEVGKDASEAAWKKAEQSLVEGLVERLNISGKSKFSFPFQQ
jgi:nanoRNase/pAp phosphatase (c-di-AMP/oligoRNAs hydrolase)